MLQRPSLWKCLLYYILKISVPWKNWNFSCRFFEVCYNLLYAFKIPLNPKSENPRRKLAISVIQQTQLVSLLVIVGVCCNRTLQVRYQPTYVFAYPMTAELTPKQSDLTRPEKNIVVESSRACPSSGTASDSSQSRSSNLASVTELNILL